MLRRKLLLISLFTVMSLTGLLSQVNVHGTVTDANGSPQENINILVTAFFADSSAFYESLFTGADGTYEVTLSPPLNMLGIVQVSMVDCWGTVVTQEFPILNVPGDIQADFVYCEQIVIDSCLVFIVEEWVPGAVTSLFAWTAVSNVDYSWSTGETTANIFPQSSGTYCVTVTFPWGCTGVDCYDYVYDTTFCFAYITTTPNNDGTYDLEVFADGTAPFSYQWDTGETTSTLDDVGPGVYCVVVTDADGCVTSTCAFIDDFSFCEVWISCDPAGSLTAIGYGEPPLSYLWSTGETTESILPDSAGLYCVTVTDLNQCTASSCFYFGSFPDSCFVFVSAIILDSNNIALQAIGSSFSDSMTFVWNTGETGDIIYPTDPNFLYCVTMTDANGCVASACFEPFNWCYAWVDLQYLDTSTAVLTVQSDPIFGWGNPNGASYVWSNGATTQEITVTEPGTYCVTATLGPDCVTEACVEVNFENLQYECAAWVVQYPDTNGNWVAEVYAWGWGEFSYLWSNGDTSSVIQLSSPNEFVCVTATNNFGCVAEACVDTFYNPCQSYIYETQLGEDFAVLATYGPPAQNSTYLWSNGSTDPTITVYQEGTYCVTVTGGGCISSSCIDVIFWNFDSCGVVISELPSPFGGTIYTAEAWGVAPFTYLWSNGWTEQSQIIDFGSPEVCVTVTDAVGCVASYCNFPGNPESNNIIVGQVFADSLVSISGYVYAYTIDPNNGTYELADSAQILQNWYRFNPLPSGPYILQAEILPGTVGFGEYMPTYHYQSATWEEADVHVLPNLLTVTTDIWMIKIDTSNGGGVIGGIVLDPGNVTAGQDLEVRGQPGVPNVTILLHDAQGNPLNYRISLQDGSFRFEGLPFGTYRISYDIPGLHSPDVWVTLTHDNPERLQIPLVLEESITDVEEPSYEDLELYPNPAKEDITIKIPGEQSDYHIQIVDMQGRVVHAGSVRNHNGIMLIDVEQYSPGLYHINLVGENALYIGRFVKQE